LFQAIFSGNAHVARFFKFCVVGGSGVLVNAGLFRLLIRGAGLDYRLSAIAAIETAIVNNFLWNYLWTFRDRRASRVRDMLVMFARFNLSSGLTAMAVNWGLLVFLKEVFGVYEEVANLAGIAAGTLANFLASHFWAFAATAEKR
jgi:dolichol-phosphate mannosyltransferase